MIVPLTEAATDTCGGKAAALGAMLRAGLPVPDGFVVPVATFRRSARSGATDTTWREDLRDGLAALGTGPVAVRSSALGEDSAAASAAGQYETVLAVRGLDAVAAAVRACWDSLSSPRAAAYRRRGAAPSSAAPSSAAPASAGDDAMAVIVQRQVDAAVAGVMFTPSATDDPTVIEASWGLGPRVVGGTVDPDVFRVAARGSVQRRIAAKATRMDRRGDRLVVDEVPDPDRTRPALDDAAAVRLAHLGNRIAALLGGPQDVEWAIDAEDQVWILQARPITAAAPSPNPASIAAPAGKPLAGTPLAGTPLAGIQLAGTPGSHGTATGTARIVRGPADFARVLPGDVLVCPWTDPAWTPLLHIAAGVVTATGGALSHAAIIARERRIPAVLGITAVTELLHDGDTVTVDGTAGTVTTIP